MPGAAALLTLAARGMLLLTPTASAAYVSPFKSKGPDVVFNLSIPADSPFFNYRGNWTDGGTAGAPTVLNPGANMSFYGAGSAAYIYAHVNDAGEPDAEVQQQPMLLLANSRINGTNLGDGRWEYHYGPTSEMLYTFAILHEVSRPVMIDSVTIETGMYSQASTLNAAHCVTEGFTENATLPLRFQGSWTIDDGSPQAWGGSVVAELPQNTSYVWINGSAISSTFEQNQLSIFMSRGTNPLNYQQVTLNSRRSYPASNMIIYQAPLDPTDQYELTLSAPANNLIKLDSITYCSYYKDGKVPGAGGKSKSALIGGVVGGVVGGLLILGALAFFLWRRTKKRRQPHSRTSYVEIHPLDTDTRSPDAFVVDDSAMADPAVLPDKRPYGSVAIPRSASPVPMRMDSVDAAMSLEQETKMAVLSGYGSQDRERTMSGDRTMSGSQSRTMSGDPTVSGGRTLSGDRTMSADSQMSGFTDMTASRQNSKETEARGSRPRPRRPRRTRHVVEVAEDGGEVRVEDGEEVVVEMLPPQYQPEWEQRHNGTSGNQ